MKIFLCKMWTVLLVLFSQCYSLSQSSNLQSKSSANTLSWLDSIDVNLEAKSTSIASLLSSLHEKTGVTLIMDDAPLKTTSNFAFHGTLREALNRLTDAFDCRWFPSTKYPKTVLLQKRFQSLSEHPQFHHHEMLQIARNVCRCLENPLYVPGQNGRIRPLLQMLYNKLDAGQIAALYRGQTISYKELTPTQTLLLDQSMYCTALSGSTEGWGELRDILVLCQGRVDG